MKQCVKVQQYFVHEQITLHGLGFFIYGRSTSTRREQRHEYILCRDIGLTGNTFRHCANVDTEDFVLSGIGRVCAFEHMLQYRARMDISKIVGLAGNNVGIYIVDDLKRI